MDKQGIKECKNGGCRWRERQLAVRQNSDMHDVCRAGFSCLASAQMCQIRSEEFLLVNQAFAVISTSLMRSSQACILKQSLCTLVSDVAT